MVSTRSSVTSTCSVGLGSTFLYFFFIVTSTTQIYTLSLHDALPISLREGVDLSDEAALGHLAEQTEIRLERGSKRSEEHTSELQSRENLVCRLLLEKKKR